MGIILYMYCSLYQEMGRVESLYRYLYPVKSLAPVPVSDMGISLLMFPVSGDGPSREPVPVPCEVPGPCACT